jgi:hypothetical protein
MACGWAPAVPSPRAEREPPRHGPVLASSRTHLSSESTCDLHCLTLRVEPAQVGAIGPYPVGTLPSLATVGTMASGRKEVGCSPTGVKRSDPRREHECAEDDSTHGASRSTSEGKKYPLSASTLPSPSDSPSRRRPSIQTHRDHAQHDIEGVRCALCVSPRTWDTVPMDVD